MRGRPVPNNKDEHRINEMIREKEVRLIDDNGDQLGVVPTRAAMERAAEAGLDLVEISATSTPPVCKIMDYGKFRFQQQKKAHEAKKKQHVVVVKEISIRPRTEEHDYQIKLKKMKEFLEKGNKVKISLRFRGREIAHQEHGLAVMERIMNDLAELSRTDSKPQMDGRQMTMMLSSSLPPKK